jgi:hypothetical protein
MTMIRNQRTSHGVNDRLDDTMDDDNDDDDDDAMVNDDDSWGNMDRFILLVPPLIVVDVSFTLLVVE